MKKTLKVSLLILLIIITLGGTGFYIWSQQTYKASEEISSFVNLNDIQHENDWLIFEPKDETKSGIILYPGAKVEPEAYSYYAQSLANNGYLVVIPRVTLNFAFFDVNVAAQISEQYPDITSWFVGGHSLGGVAAASYAYNNLDYVKGLIFLASYPSNSNDFSKTELPILSLYAEFDALTTKEKIKETKHLLSPQTTLYEIQGGNHAQFGMYGAQKGDGNATISAKTQQDQMIQETLRWLNLFKN